VEHIGPRKELIEKLMDIFWGGIIIGALECLFYVRTSGSPWEYVLHGILIYATWLIVDRAWKSGKWKFYLLLPLAVLFFITVFLGNILIGLSIRSGVILFFVMSSVSFFTKRKKKKKRWR